MFGKFNRSAVLLVFIIPGFIAASVWWLAEMGRLQISRAATVEAGAANLNNLISFWISFALVWVFLTLFIFVLYQTEKCKQKVTLEEEECSVQATFMRSYLLPGLVIVMVALAMRVTVIITHNPCLSDDIWRYILDGRTVASGHNPYLAAPEELGTGQPVFFAGQQELVMRVNNPDLVTIYLPTSQLIFGLMAVAAPEAQITNPDEAGRFFRWGFMLFDVAGIIIILFILYRRRRNVWWGVIYAWHPLVISEVAGSGHQDSIGITIMLSALFLIECYPKRVCLWAPVLALSGGVKPFPIPLAAVALRGCSVRKWFFAMLSGFLLLAILFLPFMVTDGFAGMSNLAYTSKQFIRHWSFYGSIYGPLALITQKPVLSRWICFSLSFIVLLIIVTKPMDLWRSSRIFLFATLLFSTTAHPWYLLWSLALVPVAFSPAVWIASLTLPWGYYVLSDVITWSVPGWLPVVTYVPIYTALLLDWLWRYYHARHRIRIY